MVLSFLGVLAYANEEKVNEPQGSRFLLVAVCEEERVVWANTVGFVCVPVTCLLSTF